MVLFQPELGLIIWMLVVFLIILGILAKYAWPVIIRSIEQRAEFIDRGVAYTRDAEKKLAEAESRMEEMMTEAHRKQIESLQETERMRREMIDDAKKTAAIEARKVIEEAQNSIEQAKREAALQIRKQVGRLSVKIAGKLLLKDLNNDAGQEELAERLLDELEQDHAVRN